MISSGTPSETMYFNPRPPCGGRPYASVKILFTRRFQSTPSVWRATSTACDLRIRRIFHSTPSVWRATLCACRCGRGTIRNFNPRPPCGGRLAADFAASHEPVYFNPRPPCGGRLRRRSKLTLPERISIHALRVEGDKESVSAFGELEQFQSTPSVWRATAGLGKNLLEGL